MAKKIPEKIITNCLECDHLDYSWCMKMEKYVYDTRVLPKGCPLEDYIPIPNPLRDVQVGGEKVRPTVDETKISLLKERTKQIPEETKQEVELAHKLAEEAIGFNEWIIKKQWTWNTYQQKYQKEYTTATAGHIKKMLKTIPDLYKEYKGIE